MLGLEFRFCMRGSYYLFQEPLEEHACSLDVVAFLEGVTTRQKHSLLTGRASLVGRSTFEGLATDRPVRGTMTLLWIERRVPYDIELTSDQGRTMHVRGQHDFMVMDVLGSITTLPASLYNASGEEIGRLVLRFDYKSDTKRLLKSLRPVFQLGGRA